MSDTKPNDSKRPTVIIGVCGSIAAYKTCELIRLMSMQNMDVHVLMTRNALRFVGKLTFETLTSNKVHSTEWSDGMLHIEMKNRASLMVIAPATANMIAKMANGIADDLISSTYLAMQVPVLVAPAMNPGMYQHAAVQRNLQTLSEDKVEIILPQTGEVICGDMGPGKLADVKVILDSILKYLD